MLDHLIMLGPVRQNEPPPQRHRPPGQTFIYDSAEMADLSRILEGRWRYVLARDALIIGRRFSAGY